MRDQAIRQFRWLSLIGACMSCTGTGGLLIGSLLARPFGAAQVLTQGFVLLSIGGLMASAVALVFARKSTVPVWESPAAYLASCVGVALPSLLVILHFARIIQRLVS